MRSWWCQALRRQLPRRPECVAFRYQQRAAVQFYEVLWHSEQIGDGGDLEEALQVYGAVKPHDDDWEAACTAHGADPCIRRYASFDAYLDNADALETIPVTAAMISAALDG